MIEKTFRERCAWDPGPWDDEPDRVEWHAPNGRPCLALRNVAFGVWCGYVAIDPGHPWHGGDYELPDVDVHGGLTFAGPCMEDGPDDERVCHVPRPGEPDDVWWLGFDCAHGYDVMPALTGRGYVHGSFAEYRTIEYVRQQCELLAEQVVTHA